MLARLSATLSEVKIAENIESCNSTNNMEDGLVYPCLVCAKDQKTSLTKMDATDHYTMGCL